MLSRIGPVPVSDSAAIKQTRCLLAIWGIHSFQFKHLIVCLSNYPKRVIVVKSWRLLSRFGTNSEKIICRTFWYTAKCCRMYSLGEHEPTALADKVIPKYLEFHSPSPSYFNAPFLLSHLRSSISNLFGDCGLGLTTSSLKIVYISSATSTAIVRCPRQHFRIVWAALTFMNELPAPRKGEVGKKCVVRVMRVSGTIRKSEEELVRRARKEVVRAKLTLEASDSNPLDRMLDKSRTEAHEYPSQDLESLVDSMEESDEYSDDD